MIVKIIDVGGLKEAIEIAFDGDEEIVELYDPNIKVNSVGEVVEDIYRKLFEIKNICIFKAVYTSQTLIGYYAYSDMLLISFGINNKYRTKENLSELFDVIRNDLGEVFGCRLWSKNLRAINWLKKNKMQVLDEYNNITELIYLN